MAHETSVRRGCCEPNTPQSSRPASAVVLAADEHLDRVTQRVDDQARIRDGASAATADPGRLDGHRLGARVPYLDPRMLVDPHDLEDPHDGRGRIEEDDGPSVSARAGKRQDHA